MKKVLTILLALLIVPMAFSADTEKQLKKAREKEKKEVLKRYKKEGWKPLSSAHSVEVLLLEHYNRLNQPNCREENGVSTRSKSKAIGEQMAMNQAYINYAQSAEQTVRGLVASEMNGNDVNVDAELNNFYAAYKREVEREIRGSLEKSFSVFRENPDGTFEVQTYFVVNEDEASKARIRAFENAIKESEAAQRHAQKIMDFVENNVGK